DVVLRDLNQTAGIRVEPLDRATAERLVRRGDRSCVLVFGPEFSDRVHRCSFLNDRLTPRGINPFFRDGVKLDTLGVEVLRDPTQGVASSIIEQVAQVTLLRVVLPWMIGRAFDEVGRKLPFATPGLKDLFSKYDLTAKTWAALTKSAEPGPSTRADLPTADCHYASPGLIQRGAQRYQL